MMVGSHDPQFSVHAPAPLPWPGHSEHGGKRRREYVLVVEWTADTTTVYGPPCDLSEATARVERYRRQILQAFPDEEHRPRLDYTEIVDEWHLERTLQTRASS